MRSRSDVIRPLCTIFEETYLGAEDYRFSLFSSNVYVIVQLY